MNIKQHNREILRGSLTSFASQGVGTILSLILSVALARILGVADVGVYYLSLSILMIVSVIGRLGLDNTLVKLISANTAKMNWGQSRFIYKTSMQYAFWASLFVSLVLFFFSSFISQTIFGKSELILPLQIMSFAIIPYAFANLHAECLRGVKKILHYQLVRAILPPLIILCCVYPLTDWLGLPGVLVSFFIAWSCALLVGVFFWRSTETYTDKTPPPGSEKSSAQILSSSLPLFWVALIAIISQHAATWALGIWGENQDVGLYNIAFRVGMLMMFILQAVNSIIGPKISALFVDDELYQLESLIKGISSKLFFISLLVLIIILFSSNWIIGFFGKEFTEAAHVLDILAFGFFFNVALGPTGSVLIMSNNEKIIRNINLFSIILFFVLLYSGVPLFGLMAAAWATTISTIFRNLVSVFIIKKKLGFWMLGVPTKLFS